MKRLHPDPAQFKAKLGSRLKRKSLPSPSDSSASKKRKEETEDPTPKESSHATKNPLSAQPKTSVPPPPGPTENLAITVPDSPIPNPTSPLDKGNRVNVEPFEAGDYLGAPRAGFSRAKEFANTVHEALLDQPPLEETDCASRSANILRAHAEVMYDHFELADDLAKEKRAWLKKKEELSSRIEKSELVKMRVLEERDQLQTAYLKRGTELEEAINRHIDAKAKYNALRSCSALTEAKLLTEVASLQSQVAEQRNINIEILEDNKELRKERADRGKVDWEVATEMPEFEPVREVLYAMAIKSAKEAVLAKYPHLDLDFLVTEEEEVEDTASEAAELGPEGKRAAGDEAGTSKVAEVEGAAEGAKGKRAEGDDGGSRAPEVGEESEKIEKVGDVNPQA